MIKCKQILSELKKEYNVQAIKLDMSSEVVTEKELYDYARLSQEAGVDLTVKIGGCDAVTDIAVAKTVNATSILAPMIETSYALKKFVANFKQIYKNELKKSNLYINIETLTAHKNLQDILSITEAENITGIVLGRDDMVKSLNLDIMEINSDKILKIAQDIAEKTVQDNKKFIIGGQIRPDSIGFLQKFSNEQLSGFETRRVVFNTCNITSETLIKQGIKKAIEFEIEWLNYLGVAENRINDLLQRI